MTNNLNIFFMYFLFIGNIEDGFQITEGVSKNISLVKSYVAVFIGPARFYFTQPQ